MYIYTPNEDAVFESLKTFVLDESTLEPLLPYSISQSRSGEHNGMHGYDWGDRYPKPMLGKNHSEETKQKWSESRKGIKPPNTGKPASNQTKEKMSLAKIGKLRPDISESNKNRTGMKYKKS
jgi:hypothetical protein